MNPMQLISLMRSGGNPMALLQQMSNGNPMMMQAFNMIQGKTPAQLQQMATNLARERGTTPEQVARNIGLR